MVRDCRIVVVEDNKIDLFIIAQVLKKKNSHCEVMEFSDSSKAVQFFNSSESKLMDLVITDINMPDVNGHEIIRTIRSKSKRKNVPIAVLTSSASPMDKDMAYQNGADSYTMKPLTSDKAEQILSLVSTSHVFPS